MAKRIKYQTQAQANVKVYNREEYFVNMMHDISKEAYELSRMIEQSKHKHAPLSQAQLAYNRECMGL